MSLVGMGGNQVTGKKIFVFIFRLEFLDLLTRDLSKDELSPLGCQVNACGSYKTGSGVPQSFSTPSQVI